jgi:hypothetical protein
LDGEQKATVMKFSAVQFLYKPHCFKLIKGKIIRKYFVISRQRCTKQIKMDIQKRSWTNIFIVKKTRHTKNTMESFNKNKSNYTCLNVLCTDILSEYIKSKRLQYTGVCQQYNCLVVLYNCPLKTEIFTDKLDCAIAQAARHWLLTAQTMTEIVGGQNGSGAGFS